MRNKNIDPQELYDRMDYLGEELTQEEQAAVNFYEIVGDFAVLLVNYRANHNLTEEQLAKQLGISKRKILRMEDGVFDISIEKMARIATQLGYRVNVTYKYEKENTNVHDC